MSRLALAPLARGLSLLALAALLAASPPPVLAQADNPYGDCCVSEVSMTGFNAWQVTCGACATNPGTYPITQPDPEKDVFVGPDGLSARSRYDAATAICQCPSQQARRDRERSMRRFDGK